MENQDIINRINKLIEDTGETKYSFSKLTSIEKSNLSKILSGQRTIGDAVINKIVIATGASKEWLLTGEGEKYSPKVEAIHMDSPAFMNVPLVSQYAYAGYLCGFADPEYVETLPTIPFIGDHAAKGEYVAFEVRGDSMEDGTDESILEGDVLICRKIKQDYWRSKLHINKWDFVIVHHTEGVLVKRIVKHDVEKGEIVIHSLNSMYSDRIIRLNDVAQLFNVIQVSRSRRR